MATATVRAIVNSKFRDVGSTSATDFKFTFGKTISRVSQFEVISVVVPYTYYGISAYTNTLKFTTDGTTILTATVTPGNYTVGTFPAVLATALGTADGAATYTATYSTITQLMTITRSAGTFQIKYTDSTMKFVLGLTGDSTMTNPVVTGAINLSGPNYLTLRSRALTEYDSAPNTSAAELKQSYILYTANALIGPTGMVFSGTDSLTLLNKLCDFLTIDMQLEDDAGNPLDLNGGNWSVVIRFTVK